MAAANICINSDALRVAVAMTKRENESLTVSADLPDDDMFERYDL